MTENPATLLLSDLSQCRPASRLNRDFETGKWQLLDYETAEGNTGTMVSAFPEVDSGELELPLGVSGPHRIHLGINYTKDHYKRWSSFGQLEVKLSGESGFRRVGAEQLDSDSSKMGVKNEIYKSVQEPYWKTADLTGESLIIRQPQAPYKGQKYGQITNLTWVRLVPLNDEEVRLWKESMPTEATKKVALLFCTKVLTGSTDSDDTYHPVTEDWCREELVPYTDCDVGVFSFEALRGNFCCYRSKIGHFGTADGVWQDSWIDPLEVFTRTCHERGLKIFVSLRMIGLQYPMNRTPIASATYYHGREHLAKKDREGNPTTNVSFAYPEVRAYWLSLLRETLDYGIDGIQLYLNRSVPVVMYEEPVVTAFLEKHGEDPRQLPGDDPRWQQHCADYATTFVREVRALVDERPGRELAVSVHGRPHKYDRNPEGFHPIRYTTDVETWLREGLVDYVMPSPGVDLGLLKQWREIGGDGVHLWPDLMPRNQRAEDYARLAQKYYDAGADGFSVWDGERRPARLTEFNAIQRLGHREHLDRIIEEGPSWYRRVWLKTLSGFSIAESFRDG